MELGQRLRPDMRWIMATVAGALIASVLGLILHAAFPDPASATANLAWVAVPLGGLAAGRIAGATRWSQYTVAFAVVAATLSIVGGVVALSAPG